MLPQNNERMQKPGRARGLRNSNQVAAGIHQPHVLRPRRLGWHVLPVPHPAHAILAQCNGGKALEHASERNQAADSGGGLTFRLVERDRIVERVVAAARAAKFGEVRSRAQAFAEVVGERADVEAGGAVDAERDAVSVDASRPRAGGR